MRKKIAIFIACLILPLGAVRADDTDLCKGTSGETITEKEECTATDGCHWISSANGGKGKCEKCPAGYYGIGGECIKCSVAPWLDSEAGSTSETNCFTACATGGRIDNDPHAYQVAKTATANRPHQCEYTLGCDVDTPTVNGTSVKNVCNSYFAYPNTDIASSSCQPQWWHPTTGNSTKPPYVGATTECDKFTKDKYYIYVSDKNNINYGKFKCYANTCDAGYVVVPDNNIVCDINNNGTTLTLGQCEPRVKDCNKDTSLSNDCTDLLGRTAAVAGLIEWDDTKQKYNYNKCTCTVMQDITDDYDKKIGTRRFQYGTISNTDGNEASWNTNAPTTQVENCYAGYYESKDPSGNTAKDTCKQTEPGYYSPAPNVDKDDMGGKQRYPCPAGRSSAAGAGSENECGIKRGTDGTKFCDNDGCFTLPPPPAYGDEIIKFVGDKTN